VECLREKWSRRAFFPYRLSRFNCYSLKRTSISLAPSWLLPPTFETVLRNSCDNFLVAKTNTLITCSEDGTFLHHSTAARCKDPYANPQVIRDAGVNFPRRHCTTKAEMHVRAVSLGDYAATPTEQVNLRFKTHTTALCFLSPPILLLLLFIIIITYIFIL
jgi:hypothetical protein